MDKWSKQSREFLLEYLCFYVEDMQTWYNLSLVNKYCSQKCKQFSMMKKKEFVKYYMSNDGYEKQITPYLPGTRELHGIQKARYKRNDGSKIYREDFYVNGIHHGRWFTSADEPDNWDSMIEDMYQNTQKNWEFLEKTEDINLNKCYLFQKDFIYSFFHKNGIEHWLYKNVSGDCCPFCKYFHHFNNTVFGRKYKHTYVYTRKCWEKSYTMAIKDSKKYYDELKRLKIARQVCDYILKEK